MTSCGGYYSRTYLYVSSGLLVNNVVSEPRKQLRVVPATYP